MAEKFAGEHNLSYQKVPGEDPEKGLQHAPVKTPSRWSQLSWIGQSAAVIAAVIALGFFAYFGVGAGLGIDAYAKDDPTKCRDLLPHRQTIHREIFVFGDSIDDLGNWIAYINGSSYTRNSTGIIVPGTTSYDVSPAGPGKFAVNYINPQGRYGQGYNGMDYVAQKYNLHSLGSSPHPSNKLSNFDSLSRAWMVSFAIGGAIADGNVYNAPLIPLPHSYSQVAGPWGYDFQVNEFATKLFASAKYVIKPTTWFFYNFVGANDIPLIANCSNMTICINNFTATHLNNLLILYELGMRNLIFTYVDGGFAYNPTTMKVDPSGGLSTFLDGIASTIFTGPTGFLAQLSTLIAASMHDLNINIVPLTTVILPISINPIPEGIRATMAQDPSAVSPAAFPFPTFLDYLVTFGASVTNTFYYDDNHPTEAGSRWYAQTFIRYLDSQYRLCNSAPG